MVVRFAPSVAIRPASAGVRILSALDQAAQALNLPVYVTSGAEIAGRAGSDPHMTGEAFDVRVRDYTTDQIVALHSALIALLPRDQFTVLYEGPAPHPVAKLAAIQYVNPKATGFHFHIQRKKGTTFPQTVNA